MDASEPANDSNFQSARMYWSNQSIGWTIFYISLARSLESTAWSPRTIAASK